MYAAAPAHSTELVTRRVAQWGSLAAALLFGLAYTMERDHDIFGTYYLATYTALVVATFVGYAIAWSPRYEVIGSVVALAASLGAYFIAPPFDMPLPNPAFLLVGLPALLHLLAVWLHGRHQDRLPSP
ncbi:hypothetical protein [Botrimarina mediterranea]|uniref:Uncharacterized protein n=1 Tax=Botrimarina mediterranea TaxID=2528022 RepID=A0A518K9X5_9BACT|nr:hypothetical protein [Botrimarina mediterranea]QDV74583.1 hypothetical protein Spa11_27890 [Botrimarina mediterranea]QDV79222.1 hypothetical protein K2D_28350 [Planctomycetes bacterium K2D]